MGIRGLPQRRYTPQASTINAQNDEEKFKARYERICASTNLQYQQGLVPMSDLMTAEYQLKEARNNYTTSLPQPLPLHR